MDRFNCIALKTATQVVKPPRLASAQHFYIWIQKSFTEKKLKFHFYGTAIFQDNNRKRETLSHSHFDASITNLMLADFAFRSFQRWFMSSRRCWSRAASSEFPRAFTIFCLFPSILLKISLWASISAWMSWGKKKEHINPVTRTRGIIFVTVNSKHFFIPLHLVKFASYQDCSTGATCNIFPWIWIFTRIKQCFCMQSHYLWNMKGLAQNMWVLEVQLSKGLSGKLLLFPFYSWGKFKE